MSNNRSTGPSRAKLQGQEIGQLAYQILRQLVKPRNRHVRRSANWDVKSLGNCQLVKADLCQLVKPCNWHIRRSANWDVKSLGNCQLVKAEPSCGVRGLGNWHVKSLANCHSNSRTNGVQFIPNETLFAIIDYIIILWVRINQNILPSISHILFRLRAGWPSIFCLS